MAIQSVQRALTILTLLSPETPRLGITEISKKMNLAKPTVHGLVQTLVEQGFLIQDKETKKYSLGMKIYELGLYLSGTLKINQIAGPIAQRLAKSTGYMTRVAIWDRDMALITLNLFPTVDDSCMFRQLGLGPRVPAYSSAVGKAILSTFSSKEFDNYLSRIELLKFTANTITSAKELKKEMEKIRKSGFATECEEYLNGLSCISVPVYDSSGTSTAAISISGSTDLMNNPAIAEIKARLKQDAIELSIGMGCPPSLLYKKPDSGDMPV